MRSLRRNSFKILVLIGAGLFLIPLFKILITSAVFAYAAYPSKRFFKKLLRNNALSSIACTAFWTFVFVNILLLLVAMALFAVNEAQQIISSPEFLALKSRVEDFLSSNPVGSVLVQLVSVESVVSFMASFISSIIVFAPSLLINASLVLLFSYYFLKDGEKMISYFLSLFSGESRKVLSSLIKKFNQVFYNIIFGYVLTAIVIGALMYASLALLNVPNSFLLALLATIFSIIPLAGALIPSVAAIIYLTFAGAYFKVIAMIIISFALSFVDNIVRAFVSDKASKEYKIHPLLFIAGIVSGSALLGPIGLVAGPMFFGGVSVLLKEFS